MGQDHDDRRRAVLNRPASLPEDAEARRQRAQYQELLQELRTILPGVQVLLAFLFTAPFSRRFVEVDELGRALYGTSVVSAALAAALLMAPTSYHRLTRHAGAPSTTRRERVRYASRITVLGILALSVSNVAALLLVMDFVFGRRMGLVLGAPAALVIVISWFAIPLLRRRRGR